MSVLDIGASDGSTSLEIIRNINVRKYFVTDLNLKLTIKNFSNFTFFLSETKELICGVNQNFMFFFTHSPITLRQKIVNGYLTHKFEQSQHFNLKDELTLALINPALKPLIGPKIKVLKYDGLERWINEKIDLVVMANLLNDSYFDENLKNIFLRNALTSLEDGGFLLLAENRNGLEHSSIFRKANNRFLLIENLNYGVTSENLALNIRE